MFSMRVRPSVRDVGTRCLNICRRTHVWSRSRPRCGGGGGRRLGDGRATDVTFPLCRRAVREPALSEGDAPGGEPRRHDRAHQCKDNAASTDTPERERGDQACDARPRRALSAHAGSASDEDGRAPRALDAPAPSPGNEQRSAPRPGHRWSEPGDELAPRTLRRGRRKIIEARRVPERLRLLGGRGGEEASLHLGPRLVVGGLHAISHKGLVPRAP